MPKRGCPFADAAPLQLKVRVGRKELSHGVCAERYSREIFGECGRPRLPIGLARAAVPGPSRPEQREPERAGSAGRGQRTRE